MPDTKVASIRQRMWRKFLPVLTEHSAQSGNPYHYYAVYLTDAAQQHFRLIGWDGQRVHLEKHNNETNKFDTGHSVSLSALEDMQEEILHYRRYGIVRFSHITDFCINYYTRFKYLKTAIKRAKGTMMSQFFAKTEFKSRERITLLNLLVNEYVQQRPSQCRAGITVEEVIERLHGELWYKHIRNEAFKRQITLLLQSLVISEDISVSNGRYFVMPKSINSIVEFEKDERRNLQQIKMQKNIVRLMIIITASTLMVTLALLSLAGIVDLHKIWHWMLNLKPLRVMLKLI